MPHHHLTNFEIQKHQNEPKFLVIYSRNNLPITKDEAYVTNLHECKSIGIHWIAVFVKNGIVTYFDSFGGEHIPKEFKNSIGNKVVIKNIYRIQTCDSVMCGYFCIGFIDFKPGI